MTGPGRRGWLGEQGSSDQLTERLVEGPLPAFQQRDRGLEGQSLEVLGPAMGPVGALVLVDLEQEEDAPVLGILRALVAEAARLGPRRLDQLEYRPVI